MSLTSKPAKQAALRNVSRKRMPSLAGLFLSFCFLTSGHPAQAGQTRSSYEAERTVFELVSKASKENDAHRYENARQLLIKAASYDPTPNSEMVHAELAAALMGMKSYSEAVVEGQKALSFDPSNSTAVYVVARSYSEMGEFEKANRFLQAFKSSSNELLRRNTPKLIEDLKSLKAFRLAMKARDLMKAEKYEQALEFLKKAALLDPSACTQLIHSGLAASYERIGQPEQAIDEAQISLKLKPNDEFSLYIIAISYHDIGDFDNAVLWLRKYVTQEKNQEKKARALEFIGDILDDKKELGVAPNSLSDYLDQTRKANETEQWTPSSMPLKVFIPDTSDSKGFRPSFRNYVLKSLDTWCLASAKKIDYRLVNNKNEADITVEWTTDPLPFSRKDSSRNRKAAGVTHCQCSSGTFLSHAKIEIRTVDYAENENISEAEAFCVAMHEVGHALGLGHSNNVCDVMYVNRSTKQKTMPTSRDSKTLARIYESYPVLAFKPKAPPGSTPDDLNSASLRPPSFMPPAIKKLNPPLFTPPPLLGARKLVPPTFIPPPLTSGSDSGKSSNGKLKPPTFIPPPFKN